MQVFQAVTSTKRVTGNPVKGKFQDHERFLIRLHKAVTRFRFRCFLKAMDTEELTMSKCETPIGYLTRIEEMFTRFVIEWEHSDHEPTRLACMFLKCTSSYLRCKKGIHNIDFWVLEKESCLWLSAWKRLNKTTYLREQCEQIEQIYDDNKFSPWMREIMRINSICVLTESRIGGDL